MSRTNRAEIRALMQKTVASDTMKIALERNLAKLPKADLASYEAAIDKGHAVAESLTLRLRARREVSERTGVRQTQVESISVSLERVLARALSTRQSGTLSGAEISEAATVVQMASERAIIKFLRTFFTAKVTGPENAPKGTASAFSRGVPFEPMPITVNSGIAPVSDVHVGFAGGERIARELRPDAIITINKGGTIIGQYIRTRISDDSSWPSFRPLANTALMMNLCISRSPVGRSVLEEGSTILVVDDISRTGTTVANARASLEKHFFNAKIYTYTIIGTYNSIENSSNQDLHAFITDDSTVRMPYDSHGEYTHTKDISIIGSPGNNISITSHEADLYFEQIERM